MKRNLLFLLLLFVNFFCFAKPLDGINLQAVNTVSDTKLYIYKYETTQEQIEYVNTIEEQIKAIENELSAEAKLICKSVLFSLQKQIQQSDTTQEKDDKKKKTELEQYQNEMRKFFEEYLEYEKTHSDVSPQFKFHKLETEFASLNYDLTPKVLKRMSEIMDGYKQLTEDEPDYAENLFLVGSILYLTPKIMGGDKEKAVSLVVNAIEKAQSYYEKCSSLVLYSQILFEEKKYEESKTYLSTAIELDTENKGVQKYKEMNEAGFSMFKENEYKKYLEKNSK